MNHFPQSRSTLKTIATGSPAATRILLVHSKPIHAESLSAVMTSWGFDVDRRNILSPKIGSSNGHDVLCADIDTIVKGTMPGRTGSRGPALQNGSTPPMCVVADPQQLKQFGALLPRQVAGLVSSNDSLSRLRAALERAAQGQRSVSPELEPIWKHVLISAQPLITPRQVQIIRLVANGFSSKQIARQLKLRPKTITNHRARIMCRLDVSSSAEMVIVAQQYGWI